MTKAEFRRIGTLQRLQSSVSAVAKFPQELKKIGLKAKPKLKRRKKARRPSGNSELKEVLSKQLPLIYSASDLSQPSVFSQV